MFAQESTGEIWARFALTMTMMMNMMNMNNFRKP